MDNGKCSGALALVGNMDSGSFDSVNANLLGLTYMLFCPLRWQAHREQPLFSKFEKQLPHFTVMES